MNKVIVNVHDLKTNYSKYLDGVIKNGEEILLSKYGKPVAKLVPLTAEDQKPRKPGILKGKIWIADDFDAPLSGWMEGIEQR